MVKIRIGQQNLGKSLTAMQVLQKDLANYDIISIQEPYLLRNGKIGGNQDDIILFYSKGPACRATVGIVNKQLQVTELLSSSHVVAVELDLRSTIIIVVSVYSPPRGEIDEVLGLLKGLLDSHRNRSVVITGDFNAKSTVWGNPLHSSDERGENVLELCMENGLELLNSPSCEATFKNANGESWIDLALCRLVDPTKVAGWKVEPTETATCIQTVLTSEMPSSSPKEGVR